MSFGPRKIIPKPVREFVARLLGGRHPNELWLRIVMNSRTQEFVATLPITSFRALEISGDRWKDLPFQAYQSMPYDQYDVCAGPLSLEQWDIIFLEQVLEHVETPRRALQHIWQMLRHGGYVVVTTPFLIRVHNYPIDCSRWTELGMRNMLIESGFSQAHIETGSWGNASCAVWHLFMLGITERYMPRIHSLKNDPRFPVMVWAFARKEVNRTESTNP